MMSSWVQLLLAVLAACPRSGVAEVSLQLPQFDGLLETLEVAQCATTMTIYNVKHHASFYWRRFHEQWR